MKFKTNELKGANLDWAVAQCRGLNIYRSKGGRWMTANYGQFNPRKGAPWWNPTFFWHQGGPIIEREGISVDRAGLAWTANLSDSVGGYIEHTESGPTPLIAAMRCYVASKLGDEVEIPEELTA